MPFGIGPNPERWVMASAKKPAAKVAMITTSTKNPRSKPESSSKSESQGIESISPTRPVVAKAANRRRPILVIDDDGMVNAQLARAARQDWPKEGIDFLSRRRDENNAAPQYRGDQPDIRA
jgi:hypothetical protein